MLTNIMNNLAKKTNDTESHEKKNSLYQEKDSFA